MSDEILLFAGTLIGINGILIALVLYFLNREESYSARILAFFLFSLSFTSFAYVFPMGDVFMDHPHLWRLAVFPSLCISPLSYMYVRSVLEQQYRFRGTDLLLFIPAFVYTFSMVPFYVLPTEEKRRVVETIMGDRKLIALEPEGSLPQGWGILFRVLFGFLFTVAQFVLVFRWRRRILGSADADAVQNLQILRWLFVFSLILSSAYVLLIFEYVFQFSSYIDLHRLSTFTVSGSVLVYTLYLIARPNILYGLKGWMQPTDPAPGREDPHPESRGEERKRESLTLEQRERFRSAIEGLFSVSHPYTQAGYTIRELSQGTGIPSYQLSAFINQEFGKNFNEWVNDHRVDHFIRMVSESDDHRQYTLEALGRTVGFKSRTTFISAVKKKTGKTPSELLSR